MLSIFVVITTYISEYIFPYLIKGIEEVLSKNGYDILLFSTHNEKEDEKGGYEICKYLIDLGHKKIAGLFKEDDIQGIERRKGYINALKENNIKVDATIIGKFKTYEEDFYVAGFTKSILERDERPTAIVCYNDKIAMKVINIAREKGLRIPEDLSVVGYDNDETIASALNIRITTIDHPKEKLGEKAAEMLLSLINKDDKKECFEFEPRIIVKDSVKKIDL